MNEDDISDPENYRHLFFDLDDTVTNSRSQIEGGMSDLLTLLSHDVIIISGAHTDQIRAQVGELPAYIMGQNGNHSIGTDKHTIWEELLEEEHQKEIEEHISQVMKHAPRSVRDTGDLIENRGAQISYSLIGHNEDKDKKRAFDPDRKIRIELLEKVPLKSDHTEVKIAGTTCFDYFMKGRHKGFNITKLIQRNNWNSSECLYFGDALFPGGNDEAVIGVIDTVSVTDPQHTADLLKRYFL